MDSANKNIKKITAEEMVGINKIENMEMESINDEQERIIEELEKVVTFLKGVHVKNKEALVHIKKPLDDLKSSLKYLPTGPFFNDDLPTEIKDNILSSLCDSNAFLAASVCQEWKGIIGNRFNEKKVVTIGKNSCDCEDNDYIEPAELLKASATHNMDAHLFINYHITEVDSKLVSECLTSVSNFTISGLDMDFSEGNTILSDGQWTDLIEGLEKKDKVMEKVELLHLDIDYLNQERLFNYLVNKVKKLTVDEGPCGEALDAKTFINKLQGSTGGNLSHLNLPRLFLEYENLCFDLADALCNVENVKLGIFSLVGLNAAVLKRLVKNVSTCTRPIATKTLIWKEFVEAYDISPEDMRNMINKMENLHLLGIFTLNQLEAIKSLPGVTIQLDQRGIVVTKGSCEIF